MNINYNKLISKVFTHSALTFTTNMHSPFISPGKPTRLKSFHLEAYKKISNTLKTIK